MHCRIFLDKGGAFPFYSNRKAELFAACSWFGLRGAHDCCL